MPKSHMTRRRVRARSAVKSLPQSKPGVKWPRGSIVYICGASPVKFGPNDKDLGGSEQAVTKLSQCWASMGRPVVVYGNVKEGIHNGVDYRSINELDLSDIFDCAIFWRSYGVRFLPVIQARKCIVDLHDSWDPKNYIAPQQLLEKTATVMVKSEYHRSLYEYIPDSKIKIVMNGVQVDLFEKVLAEISESARKPHRFIYASSYERGLEPTLRYTWPLIKKAIPDATFDIYYGMNRLAKTPLGDKLRELFKQAGVKEHGRIPLEKIAEEKAKSAIHLYISNSKTEIDCISVRESLLCGSVPLLGNDYVFKERDGVHVSGSTDKPQTYKDAAKVAIDLMKNNAVLTKKREQLRHSDTIISWFEVAKKWLQVMK